MSKKIKNVNEEVNNEVKANEEVAETQEEVVAIVEKKRFNLKTIGKIAVVTLTVVAGAIIAVVALGAGNEDDTVEITTDENGDIIIHDTANDSDAESKDE